MAGQRPSSPQQGWVGDLGWAPVSMRGCPCGGPQRQERFFFFRTWALSCELQHYLVHFFVSCTFLLFYRFYEFFWAVVILTKLSMWTFIFFFQMLVAHFPSCDYPFFVISYPWFRPSLFGLGSANLCNV